MESIVFIDTETGGTNPQKHSLLSVGLVAWNQKDGIVATREIFIKSKEYIFTKEAKKLNKFDQEQHETIAISHRAAIKEIRDFCISNTAKTKEIQVAGHNIQFDVAFLKKMFEEQNRSYNSLFSHRMIDTFSILKYLKDAGKIDVDQISSAKAFKLFNIMVNGRHSALGDAVATAKLYEALIKVIS